MAPVLKFVKAFFLGLLHRKRSRSRKEKKSDGWQVGDVGGTPLGDIGQAGNVYWGRLRNGTQIAVKRLDSEGMKPATEFCSAASILGAIRHKNLLSLRGYCAEGSERLTVYDYMPNLSLQTHLHAMGTFEAPLNWQHRMIIALGSAEGLLYLHQRVSPPMVHGNVKSGNVILNSKFEALLSDFGFSQLMAAGASDCKKDDKATLGYIAPEYLKGAEFSQSCDVYSFGILLTEIITGRKPIETVPGTDVRRTIMEWAVPFIQDRSVNDLADPKLQGQFVQDELSRAVHVATMCTQSLPQNRPTMLQVVCMLKDSGHQG